MNSPSIVRIESELLFPPPKSDGVKGLIHPPASGAISPLILRRTPSHDNSEPQIRSPSVVKSSGDSKKHKVSTDVSCWQTIAEAVEQCVNNCTPSNRFFELFNKGYGGVPHSYHGLVSDHATYPGERF